MDFLHRGRRHTAEPRKVFCSIYVFLFVDRSILLLQNIIYRYDRSDNFLVQISKNLSHLEVHSRLHDVNISKHFARADIIFSTVPSPIANYRQDLKLSGKVTTTKELNSLTNLVANLMMTRLWAHAMHVHRNGQGWSKWGSYR